MPIDNSPLSQASHAVAEASRLLADHRPDEAAGLLSDTLAAASWTGEVLNVLTHNLIGALR